MAFRWLLVGTVGFLTAVGCDGTDTTDAGVDVVLESTPGALGAESTCRVVLDRLVGATRAEVR